MKILDVSAVTDAAQIKIKKGTLQFLQDAPKEIVSSVLVGLIGPLYNPLAVYIIHGCINTGDLVNYIISSGAAFYQGEVFPIDAATFSVTGLDVAVFSIAIIQYTTDADPMTFTDSTTHNVHNIRKLSLAAGATGSGTADYSQAFFLNFTIPEKVVLTGAGVTGTYPNFVIPGLSNAYPILYGGSFPVGNLSTTTQSFSVTFPTVGTSDYFVGGSIISAATDPGFDTIPWSVKDRTPTGFTLTMREAGAWTQSIIFDYWLIQKVV